MTLAFQAKRFGASVLSGIPRLARVQPRQGFRVLTYHSVGNRVDGDIHDIYNMSSECFENHIETIVRFSAAWSIPIVPFESNCVQGIAITFDDGYVDALSTAAPVLMKHGLPFHVFITPTKLESGDARYLTTAQLRELASNSLVTVGAHGYEHRPLTEMSATDAEHDLRRSREALEDVLGRAVRSMSYPFGMVNQEARDAAARAGFSHAACSKWGFNHADTDRMMLRRIDMWARDRQSTVVDKVSGNWNWFGRFT